MSRKTKRAAELRTAKDAGRRRGRKNRLRKDCARRVRYPDRQAGMSGTYSVLESKEHAHTEKGRAKTSGKGKSSEGEDHTEDCVQETTALLLPFLFSLYSVFSNDSFLT